MSIHSEVNNLFKNKSGNAQLYVRTCSGDTENSKEYFDILPSGEPSAFECLTQDEQKVARKKFLLQYFTLLKARLNRFEFEYVRQLYAEGQAESVVCENLGLNPKKFKSLLQRKLSASVNDINELVAASDWDDAEIFSRCFLSAPQDINDVNEINFLPKTVKGFGNLIERLAYRRYRKIYKKEWYKRRDVRRDYYTYKLSPRTLYSMRVKDRVKALEVLFRVMSFDFLLKGFEVFEIELHGEQLAEFERYYKVNYNVIKDCINGLYQIIVNGVPIDDVDRAERRFEYVETTPSGETLV